MANELTLIPRITIYPTYITTWFEHRWSNGTPKREKKDIPPPAPLSSTAEELQFAIEHGYNPKTGTFSKNNSLSDSFLNSSRSAEGKISKTAKKKMSKCIDFLLLLANNKLAYNRLTGRQFHMKIAFLTLTLPSEQIHSDNEIKSKCLNQFLIEIQRKFNINNYVWRAEKQKNGNIHFHIIVDHFCDYTEIRDIWNRITEKLGYVTRYREERKKWFSGGFKVRQDLLKKWSYKKQLRAYKNGVKNDWWCPNSTDIHSVRNVINIKSYVTKYMTKNESVDKATGEIIDDLMKQQGRLWGASRSLSSAKGASTIVDSSISEELTLLEEDPDVRSYHDDYFSVYYVDWKELTNIGATEIFQNFAAYLSKHFGYTVQNTLFEDY